MAPIPKLNKPTETHNVSDTSAPFADYFFISGIESSQVYDERLVVSPSPAPVEDTIVEDEALVTNNEGTPEAPHSPNAPTDTSKRRSRYSFEARKSIGSIINTTDPKTPASNRSSTTIRAGNFLGGSGPVVRWVCCQPYRLSQS